MNNLLQVIKERRTIRKYQNKPISDELLNTVLEAGRWAQSWANTQCWHVIVVKDGKIKEIVDVRDETDLDGLKITIDVKKSSDPEAIMNKLYKLTPLQDSFSCNFNILINGKPRVMGIKEIIDEWVRFRINCIRRQISYDVQKKKDKLHLLQGLKKILLDIDKAIKIIRETEKESDVVPNLMNGFEIDSVQAEFIAEIKLRNLNREYIIERVSEVETLLKEIKDLEDCLRNESRIKKIIVRELLNVSKKYAQLRRTEIINEEHIEVVTHEHFIEDYNVKIFLTNENYLKKIPLVSLRANPEHKLKENDFIIQEIECRNKSELLLFSDRYVVYKVKVHEINDCKASSLGEYLANMLGLEQNERIIYIAATDDYEGYMIFGYENGKFAKIPMQSYETKTNRKKLTNAYSDLSKLVYISHIKEDCDLVAYSNINKVLAFNTSSISIKTTRDSQGIQVLKEKNGSRMIKVCRPEESGISDLEYYKTKNIPAVGCYLKKEDAAALNPIQMTIEGYAGTQKS